MRHALVVGLCISSCVPALVQAAPGVGQVAGSVPVLASASAAIPASAPAATGISTIGGSVCANPQLTPFRQGQPHLTAIPGIESVTVSASKGGLTVGYLFARRLPSPPEGVYFSWSVYLYHRRTDASGSKKVIDLQLEHRGAGWQPSGWTMSASTYSDNTPVEGQIVLSPAGTELSTYFPPGFVNLKPPLYWYATQEAYRAYLPTGPVKHRQRNFNVFGSLTTDCPAGVRTDPDSLPHPTDLLALP